MKLMTRTAWIAAVSLCGSASMAYPAVAAQGNVEAGRGKSLVCQACHGADGNSIDPMYPRLAGQYPDYLARALHAYKTGERKNAIMAGFATTLTDQEILDLATFYGTMPGKLHDLDAHFD